MIVSSLVNSFALAARALVSGQASSGLTSNGLKKLDFKVGDQVYTAMEQNLDKLSTPGALARKGHQIVQIKDDQTNILLGNVDLTEGSFNSYEATPTPIDINDIRKAVEAVSPGASAQGLKIVASRTVTPTSSSSPTRPSNEVRMPSRSNVSTLDIDEQIAG